MYDKFKSQEKIKLNNKAKDDVVHIYRSVDKDIHLNKLRVSLFLYHPNYKGDIIINKILKKGDIVILRGRVGVSIISYIR